MCKNFILWLFVYLFSVLSTINAQPQLHPSPLHKRPPIMTGEGDKPLIEIVTYVGYQDTIISLLDALYDENIVVATSAAALLRRYPKSEQVIGVLNMAIADQRELLAVSVARSLLSMGRKEWVPQAILRLPMMKDRVAQVQLSGVLAKAGNTEGLKYVINAILDNNFTPLGLEQFAYFDGKLNERGERIVVVDELSSLAEKAQPEIREKILQKVKQLQASRNK